jgi:hypothetical protein
MFCQPKNDQRQDNMPLLITVMQLYNNNYFIYFFFVLLHNVSSAEIDVKSYSLISHRPGRSPLGTRK